MAMESCDDVFDHYAAHILSGLIISKGVDFLPLSGSKESEYERLIDAAFDMTEIVMHERELRGFK